MPKNPKNKPKTDNPTNGYHNVFESDNPSPENRPSNPINDRAMQ